MLPVLVPYHIPVEQLMIAGGYYSLRGGQKINSSNFPPCGQSTISWINFIHFERYISTEELLINLRFSKKRPANLFELLSLGIAYPWLRRYIIVGFDRIMESSTIIDPNVVLTMERKSGKKVLSLESTLPQEIRIFNENCIFAVI